MAWRLIVGILSTVTLAAIATVAAAESDDFRICGLLCSADSRQMLRDQLQLRPIAEAFRPGVPVYRILAVDGWHKPLPAITFSRTGDCRAEGRLYDGVRRQFYTRSWHVSDARWNETARLVVGLPQALAKDRADRELREKRDGAVIICADGWSDEVDTADGGQSDVILGNCPDISAQTTAKLAQIAVASMGDCSPADERRGAWSGLVECFAESIQQ